MELFDSKYLGNRPAPWSATAAYATGDMVTWFRPDVYWNLPVNYRYINGPSCNSANPEPGRGDPLSLTLENAWRSCWEWASLYRLREGVAAHALYTDLRIGVEGDDIITTVMKWIRTGYSPTNPLLSGTAHDGRDIGAVPVRFPPVPKRKD